MEAMTVWWIALAACAIMAGAAVTGVLVAPRRVEPLFGLVGVLSAGVALISLATIAGDTQRLDAGLFALAFLIAFGAGGYALASTLLLSFARTPVEVRVGESAPLDARPAILVCRCVEPERYEFVSTASMLQGLADAELMQPTMGTLPMLFLAQKARYRLAGGTSQGTSDLDAIAVRLQDSMREVNPVVTWATCAGRTRLAVRVAEALENGHRRVAVVDLSVSPGVQFKAALNEAEIVAASVADASIMTSACTGDRDDVLRLLTQRAVTALAGPSQAGVVLVGLGQPLQGAERDPQFRERETSFLNRLRMMLLDEGIDRDHVRIAWSEWEEPDVTSEVRHLAALGCAQVLVLPATWPVETLATRSDLRAAVRAARLNDDTEVTIMPAWGPDPVLIAAIAAATKRALEGD